MKIELPFQRIAPSVSEKSMVRAGPAMPCTGWLGRANVRREDADLIVSVFRPLSTLRRGIPLLATREQIKAAIAEKEAGPPLF
jgi:hypothetical protein